MSTLRINSDTSSADSLPTPTPVNTPVPIDQIPNFEPTTRYSVENAIKNAGYTPLKQIDRTLQGSVWKVSYGVNTFVIKVTNISLHKHGVTYLTGTEAPISENIVKEKTILRYLSEFDPPESLATYTDFFFDEFNYFLVQQYAGKYSLFAFVKQCHDYVEKGIITLKSWHSFCKIALKQIVDLLDWLHNTMHCCHLDISLENFVIDNVMVTQHMDTNQITFSSDFQIKLIDFGVAEVFYEKNEEDEIEFNCSKYVGKKVYKAPEVYSQKNTFDARAADCWSLAVVFFMMIAGCPPWLKPSRNDEAFRAIMKGQLPDLLLQWDRLRYFTADILDLIDCLFVKEKYRLRVKDIKKHPFLL